MQSGPAWVERGSHKSLQKQHLTTEAPEIFVAVSRFSVFRKFAQKTLGLALASSPPIVSTKVSRYQVRYLLGEVC
jgi:hypothetical protein